MTSKDIVISNLINLTNSIIKTLPFNVCDELGLFECDEEDQDLLDEDAIICNVNFNGDIYTMIHWFPGDNPMGMIYRDSKINEVERMSPKALSECINNSQDLRVIPIGEGFVADNKLSEWYAKVTQDCCNYENFCITH